MTDLLIVCSPGGHFNEALSLIDGISSVDYKFVLHDIKIDNSYPFEIISAPHVNRDIYFFVQFIFAFKCIFKERPKIIMSTGSSIAVSFFIAALFFRTKTIYIESPTRIYTPSLTAKIVRYFCTRMYVRYPTLLDSLPSAIYVSE